MNSSGPWLSITLRHPPAAAEAVSALLFEAGAAGLWEDRPDERGRVVTRAGFAPQDRDRLAALASGLIDRLAKAFGLDPGEFDFELELEEGRDWAEKWKEGLEPVLVSPALAVAPTWWPENDLPDAAVVLRLDPGLAFGSGHHATTWLCLKLLADLAPRASRILDVGFGSGILALAASALNPDAEVLGVDNDPETLAVAEANAAFNGLAGHVSFSCRPLEQLRPPIDLIAANLTLAPLLELAPLLTGLAGPSGRLVLSGLLDSQASEAASVYEALGWTLETRLQREEWVALSLSRAGREGEPL
ncbi:MAG: 50S ribosomal protein L11 methyltransferase [Candidatus Adiutrix sp.]|jgi:ribosomal protein L11 methyltransferase|nr:50S ribosomal protein L11 methyltransferase [Candidatus Adiutrix sp.]